MAPPAGGYGAAAPVAEADGWWLNRADVDDLELLLDDKTAVPLREDQKEQVRRWQNGQSYNQRWLQVCEADRGSDKDNFAAFLSRDQKLHRIRWKVFTGNNYLRTYSSEVGLDTKETFVTECEGLVTHVLKEEGVQDNDIADYVLRFKDDIKDNEDVFKNDALKQQVQRVWSSGIPVLADGNWLNNWEFCSILNHAIRGREQDLIGMKFAVKIARTMNDQFNVLASISRNVTKEAYIEAMPKDLVSFRGGELPQEHREFFRSKAEAEEEDDKKYRAPMFLATSEKESVANSFMRRKPLAQQVLWKFYFPEGRDTVNEQGAQYVEGCCLHVNKVAYKMMNIPVEETEHLLPPFSVFSVRSFDDSRQPCVVELDVMPDGKKEREDLPLAPWH